MKITYFNSCERPEMEVERLMEKDVPEVLDMIRTIARQVIEHHGLMEVSFYIVDGDQSICVAWVVVQK